MRRRFFFANLALIGVALAVSGGAEQAPQQPMPPAGAQATSPAAPQIPPTAAKPTLNVVVLDPAHGGADAGAHGASGVLESEVVMSFARLGRLELERQGLRVVLTRQANENPSFDDRSAVANAHRGAVFISLHVSSTGPPGTARVYSVTVPAAAMSAARPALLPWDQAQDPFAESSRRLAELVQIQLAQKFPGSAAIPSVARVRQLRTVAAPAVAIEISSVAVRERTQLEQMGPALGEAVARGVAAFRAAYEAGAK